MPRLVLQLENLWRDIVTTYHPSRTLPMGGTLYLDLMTDTIRIWNAETGAVVGKPLEGHSDRVRSVAYSPDGRHIISGSDDNTIRIWDAETSAAVGKPLSGHTSNVTSVAYSPDGRYIISGSDDKTIRIWDAEISIGVGRPLEGEIANVRTVACSPNEQHMVSGSNSNAIRVSGPSSHQRSSSRNPVHAHFYSEPDSQGWVRDSDGGLLYWVPLDCRRGLHSSALITIPPTSDVRSVSLDFEEFAFGPAWPTIFSSAQR
jgi:WD40 repeat protein